MSAGKAKQPLEMNILYETYSLKYLSPVTLM
jgi:hypothetical protein